MKEPFKLSKEFDDVFNATLEEINKNQHTQKYNFRKYSAIAAVLLLLFTITAIGADATGIIDISEAFELMFGFEADNNNTALIEELKSDSEAVSICGDYTLRIVHAIDDGTSGMALLEIKAKDKIFKPDMFIREYQTKIDSQAFYSGHEKYITALIQPSLTVIPANETIGEAITEIRNNYEEDKAWAQKQLNSPLVSAEDKKIAKQSLSNAQSELARYDELLKRFGNEQPVNNINFDFEENESFKEYYARIWNISEKELDTYSDTLYMTITYMCGSGFKPNSLLTITFKEILEMAAPYKGESSKEKTVAQENFSIEWRLSGNSVSKEIPVNDKIGGIGVEKVVISPMSVYVYYSEKVNEEITTVVEDNVIIYQGNIAQNATMVKGVRYKDGSTRVIYADGGTYTAPDFNMLSCGKTLIDIDNVQSIFLGQDYTEIPIQ